MAPESGYHSSLALACEPAAVPAARRYAMDTLAKWGIPDDSAYDALTIVTELATNAVSHAGGWVAPSESVKGRSGTSRCLLELWTVPRGLCISVWDESNQAPLLRVPSDSAESGRGLHVVAELCRSAWGFTYPDGRPGKVVWARLPLSMPEPLAGEEIDGGVPTEERPGALSASATFRTVHEAHTRTPRMTTGTVCPPQSGYSNDAATIARTHTLLALSQADRYLADLPVDDSDLDTLEAVLAEPEFGVLDGVRIRELAPGMLGTLRRLASRVPPSAGFVPVVQSVMDDVRHDDHAPPDVACLRRWALAVQDLLEQAAARYEATARSP